MGGGIGCAVDQRPAAAGLRRRNIARRRGIDGLVLGGECAARHGDHAGMGGREAAVGAGGIIGGDHRRAARHAGVEQHRQQAIGRAAKTHVDDGRALVDRMMQRLGEAEAVADGGTLAIGLPAGAQARDTSSGGDTGDADPIVGPGGDDAGDFGAVALGGERAPRDEVHIGSDLSGKVWMARIDTAVDNRDRDAAPCRQPMHGVQPPEGPGRLGGIERIVMRGSKRMIIVHRLGPLHVPVARNRRCLVLRRRARREAHHHAVQVDERHRPVGNQRQMMGAGDAARLAHHLASPELVAIAAAIAAP